MSVALIAGAFLGMGPSSHAAPRFSPVSHFHDLAAGTGVAGFEDGEFYRARFRGPLGLAVLEAKRALAVSDYGNDRIRVVWLDENNRVDTLAGSGQKGSADGPLRLASFNGPASMTAISDHSLVVNDTGNSLFRLIDVKAGRVETLAGNGLIGVEPGRAREAPLGDVWNLVFAPAENAIYFSQPDLGTVRRLDLASRTIATVLQGDSRVPHPAALALFQGRLQVADREGQAWTLRVPLPAGVVGRPVLEPLGYGKRILAMAGTANRLFALQLEPEPAWICLSNRSEVVVPGPWGSTRREPYLRLAVDEPVGFISDPRAGDSFFAASSSLNAILCLKEYRFQELRDSGGIAASGLVDFEYPARKPEKAFRILVLGDSRMNLFDMAWGEPGQPTPNRARTEMIPKRLELMLNTEAALDGVGMRYEVLALTRVSGEPLLVWPIYQAAPIVKKFDVDLVLLMLAPSTSTVEAYIERPMTARGIPAAEIDPEYLLQPLSLRMHGNPAKSFVEACQARGFGRRARFAPGEWESCGTAADSPGRAELLTLLAGPLRAIRESLRASRPGGKTPAFQVCYFGTGPRGAGVPERGFWREVCQKAGVSWLDLLDPLIAISDSWYPLSGQPGATHFDKNGHIVFAFVLAHQLIRRGIVPFGPPVAVAATSSGLTLGLAVLLVAGLAVGYRLRRRRRGMTVP